jgi:recombination protein RecA
MSSPVVLKANLESALGSRFAAPLTFRQRPAPELVSTGIPSLDSLAGGLPRGAITEIFGSASSGRTSLLLSILAAATTRQEACALVDASDTFDPASSAVAGVDLAKLLWIRCAGNPEHALQAADWLVQGGGFAFVVLDLGDLSPGTARRIPLTSWFRFQRAIENTPTVLMVLDREPCAKSCASLILEMKNGSVAWSGSPGCSRLLRGARVEVTPRKPPRSQTATFEATALVMPQSRGPWDKLQLVSGGTGKASGQAESLSHPARQAIAPETEALHALE